jgi:hypothetical protein
MVGMFRHTLRHDATVMLIETIDTILNKIMSWIYENNTALCFKSDPFTVAILKMYMAYFSTSLNYGIVAYRTVE